MGIGAIGAIGTINYNPYIYNTNQVDSSSLNAIKAIPDDATLGGADYSRAVEDKPENINPLSKGESVDFAGILMSQMSMSAVRQSQLLVSNPQDSFEASDQNNAYRMNKALQAYAEGGVVA